MLLAGKDLSFPRCFGPYPICFTVIALFQILAVCFVRKAMDYIFTQKELFWLDHILPDVALVKKEDHGSHEDGLEEDDIIPDDDPEVARYKEKMKLSVNDIPEEEAEESNSQVKGALNQHYLITQ